MNQPKITDLTDEEINVRIAEHLGLPRTVTRWGFNYASSCELPSIYSGGYHSKEDADAEMDVLRQQGFVMHTSPSSYEAQADLPAYCTDLNAMHEAEKALASIGQQVVYEEQLYHTSNEEPWDLIHATAKQRAQAFLIAVGKAVQ